MIPKITPKIESKITNVNKKLPSREVIITHKDGKDFVTDVFIGGYPRYSVIETLKELFRSLFNNNHHIS